eukprot:scaffold194_cov277-Pinguiococcus_pyrenoidosus.AAC.9
MLRLQTADVRESGRRRRNSAVPSQFRATDGINFEFVLDALCLRTIPRVSRRCTARQQASRTRGSPGAQRSSSLQCGIQRKMRVSPVLLWCVLRINAQTTLQELWDGPGMALEALFQLAEDTGEISFRHDRSFVSETLSGGRGIFAREKLNVDDEVLSVALNGENRLYISMEDVVRSPLGASSYLRENLSPNGMLALFLCIHATFGSDSEWHAYLSSLPGFEDALDSEVSSVAELRRVQERRWQNSSSFGSVLQKRLDAVEAEWEVVQNALFGEDDAVDTDTVEMRPLLSASKISLGFFHWALRIVFSRLHSIQVLVPDDSEEEMWKTRAVLLPIADLFNFGPARSKSSAGAEDVLQSKSANVECFTTDDGERYTCVANTKVLPGEELFVDYSRRELNSFQLMLDYGFALPSTLLSGGREMRTLMYNASVAQVPFFAVEDYEASQGLREEKTKLLRTVFGDSFDAFMDQGTSTFKVQRKALRVQRSLHLSRRSVAPADRHRRRRELPGLSTDDRGANLRAQRQRDSRSEDAQDQQQVHGGSKFAPCPSRSPDEAHQ